MIAPRRPTSLPGLACRLSMVAQHRQDFAAFRMCRDESICGRSLQADSDLVSVDAQEDDSPGFEGQSQLRLRCPVQAMTIAFIVADRAAGHTGAVGELHLGPVEKASGRSTERWC